MAQPVFSASIDLSGVEQARSGLKSITDDLKKAQNEYNKMPTILDKISTKLKNLKQAWDSSFIKKALVTPLKAAWNILKGMVLTAGALGAALLATTIGSIQNQRQATSANTTRGKNAAWAYAQENSGLDSNEFNLANLMQSTNDITKYGDFAQLGLNKDMLKGMQGDQAMFYAWEKLRERLKTYGDADASEADVNAIQSLFGVNINDRAIRDFIAKRQGQFKSDFSEASKRRSGINYNEMLKGERALNKFKDTMKTFGMTLASNLLPIVTNILNKFQGFLPRLQPALEALGDFLLSMVDKTLTYIGKVDLSAVMDKAINFIKEGIDYLGSIDYKKILDSIVAIGSAFEWIGKALSATFDIIRKPVEWLAGVAGKIVGENDFKAGDYKNQQWYKDAVANGIIDKDMNIIKDRVRGSVDVNIKIDGKHIKTETTDLLPATQGGA